MNTGNGKRLVETKTLNIDGWRRLVLAIELGVAPKARIYVQAKRGSEWRSSGQFLQLDVRELHFLSNELQRLQAIVELTKDQASDRSIQERGRNRTRVQTHNQ